MMLTTAPAEGSYQRAPRGSVMTQLGRAVQTIAHGQPFELGGCICGGYGKGRLSPTVEFGNGPIGIGDSLWSAARTTLPSGVHAAVGVTALVTGDVPEGATIPAPRSQPVMTS